MADRTATISQLAAALGFKTATVQAWARKGRVPFDTTLGGHYRFDIDEVRAVLDKPRADPPRRNPRRPPLVRVEIRQDVYGDTQRGPRLFITHRDYPAVPRIGEFVDLAEGWCCETVRAVYWTHDGRVVVQLEPEQSYQPGDLDEHLKLLELGWYEP